MATRKKLDPKKVEEMRVTKNVRYAEMLHQEHLTRDIHALECPSRDELQTLCRAAKSPISEEEVDAWYDYIESGENKPEKK